MRADKGFDAPNRVRKAVLLLWAAVPVTWVGIVYLVVYPEPDTADFREIASIILGLLLLVTLVYGLFVYFASRGRNWARYALVVWTLGDVGLCAAFPFEGPAWGLSSAMSFGCLALEA